jgi:hypothetical protein
VAKGVAKGVSWVWLVGVVFVPDEPIITGNVSRIKCGEVYTGTIAMAS